MDVLAVAWLHARPTWLATHRCDPYLSVMVWFALGVTGLLLLDPLEPASDGTIRPVNATLHTLQASVMVACFGMALGVVMRTLHRTWGVWLLALLCCGVVAVGNEPAANDLGWAIDVFWCERVVRALVMVLLGLVLPFKAPSWAKGGLVLVFGIFLTHRLFAGLVYDLWYQRLGLPPMLQWFPMGLLAMAATVAIRQVKPLAWLVQGWPDREATSVGLKS